MFALSVGFLDSNDVVVVEKFIESSFLGFPAGFGEAFGDEEAVGVPSGKRERGGIVWENAVGVLLFRWELLGVLAAGGVGTSERVPVGGCQRLVANDFLV